MPDSPPEPTGHLEIETKLEADPDFVVPDLESVPGLPTGAHAAAPVVLRLRATYFDTRRLDLVRSKVTLRRREGGIDDGWHLKLPAGSGARRELAVPLTADGSAPLAADGSATAGAVGQVPAALATLVAGLSRGRRLRPVAEFATTRTVRRVLGGDGTALVEIADDAVTATRLLPGAGGKTVGWRELEVEVLDGTREQMAAVCRALVAAGARPSASSSKLARALGVEDAGSATGGDSGNQAGRADAADSSATAADRAEAADSPPTAADVVTAALQTYRRQLLGADVALRHADPDAESLHDARAAARRIRSVLTVYEPLFLPGSVSTVSRRLKKLGTLIGSTRDLDVVTERVLAGLQRNGGDHHREGVAEHAGAHRRHHLDLLRHRLTARGHLRALRALDRLVEAPPWTTLADRPATEALPPMLTVAWYRLRALAEAALADPAVAHKAHEVRKAAKTVRYAAETAAPALGAGAETFAAFAEQVQDVLGEHQDAVTTARAITDGSGIGESGVLPPDLVGRLSADEERQVGQTFAEFVELWAHRPERPR